MNPGPVEEIGATARSTVEAMRAQPGLIFLTIVNIAFLVFVYFGAAIVKDTFDQQQSQMNDRYKLALTTVDRCIEAAFRTMPLAPGSTVTVEKPAEPQGGKK